MRALPRPAALLPLLRRGASVYGLAIGLAAGVAIAAVVVPRQQDVVVEAGRSGGESVEGDSAVSGSDGVVGEATGEQGVTPAGAGVPGGARSAGGAVGGSAGGAAAAPGRAGGSAAAAGAAAVGQVRGVTDTEMKVGIAIPDLGALKALGPRFDNGNPKEHFEAILDRWKREKVVPLAGRNLEFAYRSYNAISPADQRAACIALVQDDKVFAVIGITYYYIGSECVAREYRTPLITSDAPTDDVFQRSHPFLFAIGVSHSRMLRNWMHWAHDRGLLRGKTIGVYHLNDAVQPALVERDMKPELAKLGYRIAVEANTNDSLGGPNDAVAVQRFRSGGVDLAILLTSKAGFQQQAEAQQYKPTYIESDHEFGTSDTTTSTYPPAQWDGTYGMTGRRVGETPAGIPLTAEGKACIANFERFSGRKMQEETTEWVYVLTACDEGKVLLHALQRAGRNLNPQSFVAGLETIREMVMNRYATATFTPAKHHGGEYQRTVLWFRNCSCWKAQNDFAPLWVP